jgi:hypothetical protein
MDNMISGYWIKSALAIPKPGTVGFVRFDHISEFHTEGPPGSSVLSISLIGGQYVKLVEPYENFVHEYRAWIKSRSSRFETLENAAVTLMETADQAQKADIGK